MVEHATVTDRYFLPHGDDYTLTLRPANIVLTAARLRRERNELHGELIVRINGHLPRARAVDGILESGAFNFSSVQTRRLRAKGLAERSGDGTLDWLGFLDEFCIRIGEAERNGKPSIRLADVPVQTESDEAWTLERLPILKRLPTVFYGYAESAKSLMAMWVAGSLAALGLNVLYADWEMNAEDHRTRHVSLFPLDERVRYIRCEKPLRDEVERIQRIVRGEKIDFIVYDSIKFALDGPADDEHAGAYFRAVRQIPVGSLHVAHTSKSAEGEKTIFGSIFFHNAARSVWYIQRAWDGPSDEIRCGFYHVKNTARSGRLPARAYRFRREEERTIFEPWNLMESPELVESLPPMERVKAALRFGPRPFGEIAEEAGLKMPALKLLMRRHRSVFTKVDGKPPRYGLASSESYEV